MTEQILEVSTREQSGAVYRLRYQIYLEEKHYKLTTVDNVP